MNQADEASSWVIFRHTPGPNAPTEGPLQADPRFGLHFAFLSQLHSEGVLVGAGPILGADGDRNTGMAMIRVPDDAVVEYERRAREEDQSVVAGFLAVEIIHWQVVLS